MRIQVRMINGASPEIKQINAHLRAMAAAVAQANKAMQAQSAKSAASLNRLTASTNKATVAARLHNSALGMSNLTKFGKNIQWTGRQIEYNFTLPLVLATAVMTKWALEQEKQLTRISKVYGDQTAAQKYWMKQGMTANQAQAKTTAVFREEIEALDRAFTALSNRFGIAKTEVQSIAADWAAAGASGKQLAQVVNATMQAMILGEFGAGEATKALMAIQAQYGADSKNLMNILMALNAVENATGATMNDLIISFSKSAGAARTAGVSYRQLAAFTAALVPAAGSAANAGNALKTIFSRILAPTGDAAKLMDLLGANTDSAAWASTNVTGRLKLLSVALKDATQQQKAAVSTYVASRYQVNRFDVLIRELTSSHGFYAKALDATASKSKIAATYQRELSAVLQSQPQQFAMVKEQIKNTLVQAIIPFIPAILGLLGKISELAQAWQKLDPNMQLFIVTTLVAVAAFGTFTRLFGAAILLIGTLGGAVSKGIILLAKLPYAFFLMLKPISAVMTAILTITASAMKTFVLIMIAPVKTITRVWLLLVANWAKILVMLRTLTIRGLALLLGPWGLLLVGIVAAIVAFKDQIGQAIQWVIDGFASLPSAIATVFSNVVRVIAKAVSIVREWLSYLNPFARHSPSLVDNVKAGVQVIASQYASLSGIGAIYRKAAADLKAFNAATRAMRNRAARAERREDRAVVVKQGGAGAGRAYDRMVASMGRLQRAMKAVAREYAKQERVVDQWARKLEEANRVLDVATKKLGELQDKADRLGERLSNAQQRLEDFMSAPLVGEKAMNQAILNTQVAQANLRLEMMNIEDVTGPIDKIRDRYALLAGDLELVSGQRLDLIAAGAGSEITNNFKEQEDAIRAQQGAMTDQLAVYDALQDRLDALGRAAERLDLEKYINFDAVHEQILLLADTTQELSREEIIAGIAREQQKIADLTVAYEAANAAVAEQQGIVDQLTEARDLVQERYDAEVAALEALGRAYDAMAARYDQMQQALEDFVAIAEKAKQAAKEAKDAAAASGGAGAGASPAVEAFINGGKGDFDDAGLGQGLPPRTDWESQVKGIDEFTKRMLDKTQKQFGSFDVFAPLKDMWHSTLDWLEEHIPQGVIDFVTGFKNNLTNVLAGAGIGALIGGAIGGPIGAALGATLGAVVGNALPKDFLPKTLGVIKGWISAIGNALKPVWDVFSNVFGAIWDFVGPDLKKFGNEIWKGIQSIGKKVKQVWDDSGVGDIDFGKAWENIKKFFNIIKPIFLVGLAWIAAVWKMAWGVINEVVGPIFDILGDIIAGALGILLGIFKVGMSLITGDWDGMWKGIVDILEGAWTIIWGVFSGAFSLVWNLVEGFVKGVVGFFEWLSDVLVGHSVIPDMIDLIIDAFKPLADLGQWVWNKVIKPVVDFFQKMWSDHVKPALSPWWENIKTAWNMLQTFGAWVWNNILKPVKDRFVELWTDYVGPKLGEWWEAIKAKWNALIELRNWVWNNILNPVFQVFKDLWAEYVGPKLAEWWENIKTKWDDLKKAASWVKENVMDPVGKAFSDGWNTISDWFTKNAGTILAPIKNVVKAIVGAINWVIRGINQLDHLPGVTVNIPELTLPESFEVGGVMRHRAVGSGFVTDGARAIVGEGKAAYPEFVIPTDPRYRTRAQALTSQAAGKLGMNAVPMHGMGGILGAMDDVIDLAGAGWNAIKDAGKNAWISTTAPAFNAADNIADKIDWLYGRQAAKGGIDIARQWVQTGQAEWEKQYKENTPQAGHPFPQMGGDWKRTTYQGHAMDVGQVRAVIAAQQQYGGPFHISQGSYSTSVAQSGSTHAGGGAMDITSPVNPRALGALIQNGQAAWIRSPSQGDWPWHIHSLHIGDPNLSASAQAQVSDFLNGGDGLYRGGIVRARVGGVMKRLGEGGQDEAVIPLPNNWRRTSNDGGGNDGGGDTYYFYGDLEFPNVTNGDDAESFLTNLSNLAKD